MVDIQKLREYLQLQGIDETEYTDEQLMMLISQATQLIGEEYVSSQDHEDYMRHYEGKTYMTEYYPVDTESVVCLIDDEEVTPHKITCDGIIYFENHVQGELSCRYLQAIDEGIVEQAIFDVLTYMIQDKNRQNMKSINEGDISITYDTDNMMSKSSQLANLINNLRNRYKARVRLI